MADAHVCAVLLIAAGRGPARVPTCEHTLRHAEVQGYCVVSAISDDGCRPNAASSVAARALSLFGSGAAGA
jgi:hypothetical protein